MTERSSFFSNEFDESEVAALSESPEPGDRWLAAIQLGQTSSLWAAQILWKLRLDEDSSTRTAAISAIRKYEPSVLAELGLNVDSGNTKFEPQVWKAHPLPKYEAASRELYAASIVDILGCEGPTTGGRVFRLLCAAAVAGGNSYPSRNQVKELVSKLFEMGSITRTDKHLDSSIFDMWILNLPDYPDLVIRPRMSRDLTEIPVNEAQAVLRQDPRFMRRPNPDMGWEILKRQYEIGQNEFHLVGEALENQWLGLFNLN